MKKIVSATLFMLFSAPAMCQATDITFTSSGTIQDGDVYDHVYVENNGTIVDMFGGQIGNLFTRDISTFNLSGGQITGLNSDINIEALSNFYMSGGLASLDGLYLQEAGLSYNVGGIASIAGGALSAQHVKVYPNAKLVFNNGNITLGTFSVMDDGQVDILGGNVMIDDAYIAYGYYIGDEYVDVGATINIHGYNFNYDPTGGTYGGGRLTGYLLDGNPFSIDQVSEMEYTSFNLIPEPMTLLLFGLGGLLLRKRS